MLLDYESLRVIWWILLGTLLIGFAIMDGFDLGLVMWLPWLGKDDMERRILINTIAPTWEGNQVWFILGAGAIFAAWPMLYALSFSGFYFPMLFILLALILRPVGLKYRSKMINSRWRTSWDWALFISGFVPTLLFGVALGNVLQGVPFFFDETLRIFYTGTFFGLLNPFALTCGLLSVSLLAMHGAFFIQLKTENPLQSRARKAARATASLVIFLFITLGVWLFCKINGYIVTSIIPHDGPSNPLYKEVTMEIGAWFKNYNLYPLTQIVPISALLTAFLAAILARKCAIAFLLSALSVAAVIATLGVSMFPFLLPSSTDPNFSLIIWDSSSSQLTLFVMLIMTLLLLPIVMIYTAWVYRVLRGKVTAQAIIDHPDRAY